MTTREQIVHNLRVTLHSFASLLDGLTPEQWATQSLCPAWTVRGVAEHIAGIETVLLGWKPGGDNPFAGLADASAQLAALTDAELAQRLHELVAGRLREIEAMTDDEFFSPSFTPVGQATYARFMAVRVFDIWVHERDITTPLGIATDDGGPAAEMSLAEVEGSIGYIVGKKIGAPEGTGITFTTTGAVQRTFHVKVDGRATRVEHLEDPTVVVTADSRTFVQLACGRIDPEQAIAAGAISASGNAALGDRACRNLAFTM
jgi:uncharacterized protein (TIGR03083 family)